MGVDAIKPFASVEEIKTQVRRNESVFGRGGGYVFATVNNIQAGVSAENILAMFEALEELR
jgi:uroporphyrinogen-III decarboxylase